MGLLYITLAGQLAPQFLMIIKGLINIENINYIKLSLILFVIGVICEKNIKSITNS